MHKLVFTVGSILLDQMDMVELIDPIVKNNCAWCKIILLVHARQNLFSFFNAIVTVLDIPL
jgi:hypothetical protein